VVMIEEHVCRDWLDVQQVLYANSWDERLGRHRSHIAFRGLANAEFRLTTTLQRMGGPYERLETPLVRNFSKYAYAMVASTNPGLILSPNGNSMWNWLVIGRHHGLPTRVLDWTYSPYVALHFATEHVQNEITPQDGVIWCVDYKKAHTLIPNRLQSILDSSSSEVFTVDILAQIAVDLDAFNQYGGASETSGQFVLFFEPPSLNERVINQFALLSMMSSPKTILDEWLEAHTELCYKIVLPAKLKWEIRDKLDQANINERLLYPGLDGLCRWLRRYYAPRNMDSDIWKKSSETEK
jgi:FRG domain